MISSSMPGGRPPGYMPSPARAATTSPKKRKHRRSHSKLVSPSQPPPSLDRFIDPTARDGAPLRLDVEPAEPPTKRRRSNHRHAPVKGNETFAFDDLPDHPTPDFKKNPSRRRAVKPDQSNQRSSKKRRSTWEDDLDDDNAALSSSDASQIPNVETEESPRAAALSRFNSNSVKAINSAAFQFIPPESESASASESKSENAPPRYSFAEAPGAAPSASYEYLPTDTESLTPSESSFDDTPSYINVNGGPYEYLPTGAESEGSSVEEASTHESGEEKPEGGRFDYGPVDDVDSGEETSTPDDTPHATANGGGASYDYASDEGESAISAASQLQEEHVQYHSQQSTTSRKGKRAKKLKPSQATHSSISDLSSGEETSIPDEASRKTSNGKRKSIHKLPNREVSELGEQATVQSRAALKRKQRKQASASEVVAPSHMSSEHEEDEHAGSSLVQVAEVYDEDAGVSEVSESDQGGHDGYEDDMDHESEDEDETMVPHDAVPGEHEHALAHAVESQSRPPDSSNRTRYSDEDLGRRAHEAAQLSYAQYTKDRERSRAGAGRVAEKTGDVQDIEETEETEETEEVEEADEVEEIEESEVEETEEAEEVDEAEEVGEDDDSEPETNARQYIYPSQLSPRLGSTSLPPEVGGMPDAQELDSADGGDDGMKEEEFSLTGALLADEQPLGRRPIAEEEEVHAASNESDESDEADEADEAEEEDEPDEPGEPNGLKSSSSVAKKTRVHDYVQAGPYPEVHEHRQFAQRHPTPPGTASQTSTVRRKDKKYSTKYAPSQQPREGPHTVGPLVQPEEERLNDIIEAFAAENQILEENLAPLVRGETSGVEGGDDDRTRFWARIYASFPNRAPRYLRAIVKRKYTEYSAKKPWTEEDDAQLVHLARRHAEVKNKWIHIAKLLGRTATECRDRHRNYATCGPGRTVGPWLASDLKPFLKAICKFVPEAVEDGDLTIEERSAYDIDWLQVSSDMKGRRSRQQCLAKWKTMRADLNKVRVRQLLHGRSPEMSAELRIVLMQVYSVDEHVLTELVRAIATHPADDDKPIPWRALEDGAFTAGLRVEALNIIWQRLRRGLANHMIHKSDQECAKRIFEIAVDEHCLMQHLVTQEDLEGEEDNLENPERTLSTRASFRGVATAERRRRR